MQDEIDNPRSVQPNLIEEDFDATTFADVDAEVIAVQPPHSDTEIVAELLETEAYTPKYDWHLTIKELSKEFDCGEFKC